MRRELRDSIRHLPGGHTIDRIRAGEVSFTVDGGTAPTIIGNAHQALPRALLGVVEFALPQGMARATAIHGLANVIWTGTAAPAAAMEFVKFLAGEEAEQILGESGATIPAYSGLQEPWLAANPDMNLQVFIDAVEYSQQVPDPEVGFEWQIEIQSVVIDGWSGDIPADEICVQAAEAANAVL